MAQAWTFGDVAAIEKLTLASLQESPELYQRLLVERNHNWIPHVEACLKKNSGCFIVVGAAHLVGPGRPADAARQEGLQGHSAVRCLGAGAVTGARVRTRRFDTRTATVSVARNQA